MYGTVARFRLKPGMEGKITDVFKAESARNVPGYVRSTVYRLDSGNNDYILAVVFADKASYEKNADDPEQDKIYQQWRAMMVDDPQWMDGEIIYDQK
jgi:quinol monooxygenase YgiN